ncbi:MarR family transcriptional regulator [Cohnella sp. CFH 77786]|uniref:MarR family winged helix-turn-helix transcriptional regulator n=1 Tax=Cohnella sp. CFH 77786 TaxID=2662265 RepID=UPI001C60A1CF|nr:MarR family transcriptional regulator [Cohnella sp. CFH 77786]MBW5444607.1 MarR family transcriptional regulator [Cohnella sp. CFH 77786]
MDDRQQRIMQITRSMRELNQSFYHATRKDAEACGITQIQYLVLRALKQHPMIGLGELSDLIYTGASTASGVIDRLVQAGLVVRDRLEEDRRAVALKLSPEGEELLNRVGERMMKRLSPLLQLSEEDVGQLLRIQGQMVNLLQQAREEP